MTSQVTDSELDNLLNDGGLALDEVPALTSDASPAPRQDLSFFGKIPVHLTLEVASTEISLKELMEVDASSVIVLDKLAGEPLDLKVNGALFAKAEVVVMNGNYGLRVLELCGAGLDDLAR
ncbi:flagellar motor switch protein FliN [Pseudomonas panipatensis]|uniref:Flagellar motor switch protein FliN n=1 Tax=Pseudomonas panipatensis TaxID=428992 RepID=A0A1G8FPF2_9PSED|nr:flagellar motor switch protein FliN [Pseudomonas panipatensis]SDH84038.1 flagellar motor switch protein FliN/FliY [Pseudomonas panipatensis]SMP52743.1 flagellar motor switch protein FliN/FliY [Pseudomonas panipatensis]